MICFEDAIYMFGLSSEVVPECINRGSQVMFEAVVMDLKLIQALCMLC